MKTLSYLHASFAAGLATVGTLIGATGCGPATDVGGYCDATGCYTCDGYGCSPSGSAAAPSPSGTPSASPTPSTTTAPPTPPPCGGTNGPCACKDDKECGTGKACVAGSCTAKENTCVFESECDTQNGETCFNGQCLDSCANTACEGGKVCQKGACVDSPVVPTCTNNTQCAGDTPVCAGGTCTEACDADVDCGDGRYCNQGACVADTRPSPNCTSDAQCGGSGMAQKCLGGFCKFSCGNDATCRSIDSRIGYCAADLVCRTASEASPECTRKSDCKNGLDCVNNQCK